jgi:hypothetical protein
MDTAADLGEKHADQRSNQVLLPKIDAKES